MTRSRRTPVLLLTLLAFLGLAAAACGDDEPADAADTTGSTAPSTEPVAVRLGYFPNVTHASAVLGVADGTFQEALGDTTLETTTFNAGPAAIEALLSGAIDATFIGPNPAINAFVQSEGDAIRILAGGHAFEVQMFDGCGGSIIHYLELMALFPDLCKDS